MDNTKERIGIKSKTFELFLNILFKNKKMKLLIAKMNNYVSHKLDVEDTYLESVKELFETDLIIDVGVFKGTRPLYSVFNNVHFHLIDPVKTKLSYIPKSHEFYEVGLSSKIGEGVKFYEYENGGMSTFYKELKFGRGYEGNVKAEKTVQTLTLDSFIEKNCSKFNNIGLKIDTQGSELDVLNGLDRMSSKIDFIIIENNITNRYDNDSHFSSCTSLLYKKGFRFLNLTEPSTVNFQHAYECVYVKENNKVFSKKL